MKINVLNGELNGWLNIQNLSDLDVVPTNIAAEISAPFCFNNFQNPPQIVKIFHDRLQIGGTLILGGYDVIEFAKFVLRGTMPFVDRNQLISQAQNFFSLDEVAELLKQAGFKIVKKKLEGMNFLVTATKL